MGTKLEDKINKLSPGDREEVLAHTKELIAEELTLRQIRNFLEITQSDLANKLEIGQHNISRLESRGENIKLATLRTYIEALGGNLVVSAIFPEKGEIKLLPVSATT